MRKKNQNQMPMNPANVNHQHAKLLEGISRFLDENPIITGLAYQDLTKGRILKKSGAQGMTAEQVLRAAVVKMIGEFCYEDLAFHLVDSTCYRNFCRVSYCHKGFKKSALCKNIKTISAETWEAINKVVVAYAEGKGIEKGRESRFDCTVVSSDIHSPSDSSLLYDAVRVITRVVKRAGEGLSGIEVPFTDHQEGQQTDARNPKRQGQTPEDKGIP